MLMYSKPRDPAFRVAERGHRAASRARIRIYYYLYYITHRCEGQRLKGTSDKGYGIGSVSCNRGPKFSNANQLNVQQKKNIQLKTHSRILIVRIETE